jgi:Ala-tRNA(Pro) deacylase
MTTARTLESYLAQRGVRYEVVTHPHSRHSTETAELAHVPGDQLAKSVVLEDEKGCVMAVLPSTFHVQLSDLGRALHRNLRLVTEERIGKLFADCEVGAIPPVGHAYGITTVVDESLMAQPQIWFEAGDHEKLVRVDRGAFAKLMEEAGRARFSQRV